MKTKVTLTIDEDLLPKAKALARGKGMSLSQLVENSLREKAGAEGESFAARWRGRFVPAERDDERYRALAAKHL